MVRRAHHSAVTGHRGQRALLGLQEQSAAEAEDAASGSALIGMRSALSLQIAANLKSWSGGSSFG
jgi:hypothetical protein